MELIVKATSLIETATLFGGVSYSRAEAVSTKMREIGHLPKGGRGTNAPSLDAVQAAAFLVTMVSVEKVEDVADFVNDMVSLVDKNRQPFLVQAGVLVALPRKAACVSRILILPRYPMVEIAYKDGSYNRFFHERMWADGINPDSQGGGFIGRIGHIGGAALHQISIEFGGDHA